MPSLLIISGSMGSGKTAVLAEASDILASRGIVHAAIDLDVLGMAHLPDALPNDDVMYRNLADVWKNYASLGTDRLLLARALENRAELERCVDAVVASQVVVCRLTASVGAMQQRVAERELGIRREEYIKRVIALNDALDRAGIGHFIVNNEDRGLTDVAREVLEQAGWL